MNLTIDNDNRTLTFDEDGIHREIPLFTRKAYEVLSRECLRVGWALGSYYTFSWAGQPLLQLPEDVLRLQEVMYEMQPEVIIETGVCGGGSLLFHATLCEAIGKGRVIGVDIQVPPETRRAVEAERVAHRITMIEGDSAAPETIQKVRELAGTGGPIMVILDSDHSRAHVLRELEAYAPLVTPGSCIIAEDGIMHDLADVPGGYPEWIDDNPTTAAREFAAAHPEFEIRQPEWKFNRGELRNNITYWPDGWLWEEAVTHDEIAQGIEKFGPWFYAFEFSCDLKTTPAIPPQVAGIHDTRLAMTQAAVASHFGIRRRGLECLDIGCHQGFYSLAMAREGMRVTGMDAREESLASARFVSEAAGFGNIRYRQGRVESLAADEGRTYPLTLFLGVLYHVEDPMLCLRQVAAVTGEMCVIETQVVDEVEGFAEWGSREWTRPYHGILALIDESGEFKAGNRETGVTPMATCPSPKALLFMCRQAGFKHAEILEPPPDAYEQHARGKRVVCAAYK